MVTLSIFFQAEDGIRDRSPSRGLGDVYKRQTYRGQKYLPEDIKNLHYSNTSYLDRQIKAKMTINETLFSYRGINYKKSKHKESQKM